MKRFLIFAVLGPLLGFVTGFYGLLQALSILSGDGPSLNFNPLVLLPLGYAFGIVPALLAALFDHVLARRRVRWRVAWTALASYGAAYLLIVNAWIGGHIHGPYLLLFGLIGAVPGAICAWLSGLADRRAVA